MLLKQQLALQYPCPAASSRSCGRAPVALHKQHRTCNTRLLAAEVIELETATVEPAVADPASSIAPQEPLPEIDLADSILLQAFGWNSCRIGGWYNIISNAAADLGAAGFTHAWLPPPSQSVSKEGYLPSELYNLNTPYGSKEELKAVCSALKANGVAPLADIVINHRSAGARGPDGRWNQFTDNEDHPGARLDWGPWAITGNDPEFGGTGQGDSGDDFGPAPDIDHRNETVRQGIKDWLRWLHDEIGFQGYRFDYVKGFCASYVGEYIKDTLGPNVFHVSELWTDMHWGDNGLQADQDGPRQALCDYLDKCGAVTYMFDFPLKGILNEVAGKCQYWRLQDSAGKLPGLIGWWPDKAVTFIDNHDTGSTQQHWPFPNDLMDQGYAYILTHPGIPSILWEHYFDMGLKDKINELINIRRRNGINSKAKVDIKCAYDDMYVAVINDRVTIKMGPRYDMGDFVPDKAAGWRFVLSGRDWAVWEKA